jgi:N12 class adenine-specific DNA methylase
MISAANAFYSGEKKYYARTAEGDFALVTMREALQSIISKNTHLTERADKILAELSTAIALPFEPTYDELNPPPEPEKEYRFSLGDTVYIGTQKYEVLAYDDNEVRLFDETFPIFNKVIPRGEFDEKLKENPLNDRLLQVAEATPGVEPQNDKNVFFVDKNAENVIWMYYNPDSTAGGQYVTNNLSFAEIRDVALETSDRSEFFETLAEIANQELADVGSPWFDEAEADFTSTPDFIGMTDETMKGLIEATKAPELTPWQEYRNIQKAYGGALVLYQVGDFFEVYGSDAVSAAYRLEMTPTKKNMEGHGTVDMFGFTASTLDENTEKLRSFGYDVVVAPIKVGKRNDYFFASTKELVQTVDTNIGNMPIEDYREITASQNGFDSYEDMYNQGVRLGNGYDKEPEPVKPAWENNPKRKTKSFDLHPEVPQAERHSFDLASNEMETVGKKERFRRNIMAIQLLKKCEDENRFATPDEQIILSKYVGWGGIPEAFDENNSAWATEYLELNAVLNEDEYTAARESTLTAFYTPPVVIRNMYKALENMSFQTGNILEPSCGVGNFLGMLPNSMKSSKLYGIELDSISGRIAGQLYQKSSIAVQGFEKTDLPDSFFDCAIGNVPFGQFKVSDKRYDKNNFLIHDYFFARTLDKVRPGGIISFVTSKGTLDKENPAVRKYIAQRADLLGAIRLPNDTFKGDAGTEVTSDILFLQKRDRMVNIEPDWVHLNTDENGIRMNQYFVDHPDMVMGDMKMISGQFGPEVACVPYDGANLDEQLNEAIQNIHAEITEYETVAPSEDEEDLSIPADPDVRNFSFTVDDGKIYYRENSRMKPIDVSKTAESRIKGLIAIRDCVRNLIEYQTEDYSDEVIRREQEKLNELYDDFGKKYGLINSRGNSTAFSEDSSYCLLCSLEVLDDEGNFIRKADMFTKRTIKQKTVIQSVDTASEALAVSLAEKVKIDMPYMCELTGKTEEALFEDLKGVIFLNPLYEYGSSNFEKYLTADEYLSGNVREKLFVAKSSAKLYPEDYTVNVEALEAVQPKDLTASEIAVRLGATWLPPDIVEEFIFDVFQTPRYSQWNIHVRFSQITGEWNIEGKSSDRGNIKAYNTYGTDRINGYKIIEETLNLRDVRIFDYIEDENGSRKPVLNKKETAIAQGKQELIKQAFADWIWNEPERREKLCRLYNDRFNSNRVREYDGSHLNFVGINPEITLRKHQVDAIARILYGGNTLLAHVVGAGKTFEMVAAAQESKRLGLCQKSLFVVPNHLTEQWASEYLQLYPSANILVATKKDFETKNRKKFCGRISTGDYDAVIIGHTQFEKIPMSVERQQRLIQQQMDELVEGIAEAKRQTGNNFTVKQLEKTRKTLQQKLDKLNDQSRKDDVVTFEELGIDRIFIDEAHYYKNLAAFSKMRNVGGISQTEAQKSSDLYMKCRYLDEITGGKGVIFATGTPISNSMVELYTMQKYLQYNTLKRNGLLHFDAWASTFGETVTAIELAPEGTGYRAKTRFARFYNLPELMMMFREVADVQTADMLKLPVPEAHYHNVVLKPTEMQKEMVADLSDRAERVRNRMVDSSVDNMLLITNDGRKLALDQRLMNDMLPDDESSKCSACADNAFEVWQKTADINGTQMIFCDLSTPHNDGKFNVYDDIRDKLIAKGVPPEEIAYIHTANSEAQKKEMFGKVRSGQIRILLGSTQKMGAGTNVQKKLVALSHLDCPWRPSDLQQREGRIIRQGNENPEVDIYTFVTENTFDSYLYQLVESKQKFIGQIMTSKSPVRSAEDVDEAALSYAEIKALATGNPHIKEKMDLDIDVSRLKLLKANHLSQKYALEDQIIKEFPQKINACEQRIHGFEADIEYLKTQTHPNEDGFSPMQIEGVTYTDKKEAGTKILEACKEKTQPEATMLGMYRGYTMELAFDTFSREYQIKLSYTLTYTVPLGTDIFGNIQRLDNLLDSLPDKLTAVKEVLKNTKTQLANAKVEVEKPFPKEEELKSKTARLDELNILLNMNKRDNEIVDNEAGEEDVIIRENKSYER